MVEHVAESASVCVRTVKVHEGAAGRVHIVHTYQLVGLLEPLH